MTEWSESARGWLIGAVGVERPVSVSAYTSYPSYLF